MDKIATYRTMLMQVLSTYTTLVAQQSAPGIETLLSFDEIHDQYLWIQTGWAEERRIYGVTVHARIVDGKIWIEQDWTEEGIASELLQAGVPREDIVLAFYEHVQTLDLLTA